MSAHRRDRCTRTLLNQGLVFDLFTTVAFVLVCLSIDVTGAPVPCPTKVQLLPITAAAFRTCVSVHISDRRTRTSINQGFYIIYFFTAAHFCLILCTCVSVHRRDRCTRTLSNLHSTVSGILLHLNTSQVQLPPRFLFTGFGILFHLTSVPVVYISTGVSVHRRDRCTCTTINQIPNSFGY